MNNYLFANRANLGRVRHLFRVIFLLLAGLSVSAQAQVVSAQTVRIEGVRIWDAPDHTRLVLDTSSKASYTTSRLTAPNRFAVDVLYGENVAQSPDFSNNPRLTQLRYGALNSNTYRLVFELKNNFDIKVFQLEPNQVYGHRIVIDVYDRVVPTAVQPTQQSALDATILGVNESPQDISSSADELGSQEEASQKNAPITVPFKTPPQRERVSIERIRSDKLIVAIDAGHGGEDPGAVGWRKLKEKDITLKIAKRLMRLVNNDSNMQAHLVREGDYFILLHNRTKIARKKRADLFVSIHADAFDKPSANGLSVFALSQRGASSVMARTLAKKENAADLIGGVSLKDKGDLLAHVLLDLSVTNNINESVEFGRKVLSKLKRVGRLHSKRVEQAGFAVLKSPDIPSILVETGFITNPSEAKKLNSASYQKSIAEAIYGGIRNYHKANPLFAGETTMLVEGGQQQTIDTEFLFEGSDNSATTDLDFEESIQTSKQIYHVVKSGEALSVIAQRNGLKVSDIHSWNKLKNSRIYIGQKLRLFDPDAVKKVAVTAFDERSVLGSRIEKYTVKRGDSLSVIAARYQLKQTDLKRLNKLRSSRLKVGQVLKIPMQVVVKPVVTAVQQISSQPIYHEVRPGDSLSSISARYNVKIAALKKRNRLKSNRLVVGKKLLISQQTASQNQGIIKTQLTQHPNTAAKQIVYRVKSGDTLSEIAQRYGKTMAEVRRANSLKNNIVYIGQKLKI